MPNISEKRIQDILDKNPMPEEKIQEFLDTVRPTPFLKSVNELELFHLLNQKPKFRPLCTHDWIRWTYGPNANNRMHRVCRHCYKKQKKHPSKNTWVKDTPVS